ncbi:MAG TPA: hypothetical protein VF003_16210 [Pseudonocardiaceae bacterium]
MDENASPYLEAERTKLANPPAADDEDFQESNKIHSINGFVYGNGPMMTMRQGERARWYVMSMGNEVDLHTPHWHGNTVIANGMRMDTVSLLPAAMVVADMVPDDRGMLFSVIPFFGGGAHDMPVDRPGIADFLNSRECCSPLKPSTTRSATRVSVQDSLILPLLPDHGNADETSKFRPWPPGEDATGSVPNRCQALADPSSQRPFKPVKVNRTNVYFG